MYQRAIASCPVPWDCSSAFVREPGCCHGFCSSVCWSMIPGHPLDLLSRTANCVAISTIVTTGVLVLVTMIPFIMPGCVAFCVLFFGGMELIITGLTWGGIGRAHRQSGCHTAREGHLRCIVVVLWSLAMWHIFLGKLTEEIHDA